MIIKIKPIIKLLMQNQKKDKILLSSKNLLSLKIKFKTCNKFLNKFLMLVKIKNKCPTFNCMRKCLIDLTLLYCQLFILY